MNGDSEWGEDHAVTGGHVLHAELSHRIVGAAFLVHSELGPGWDECDYHRAMKLALEMKGLQVDSKLHGTLYHRGLQADQFELDLLVEGVIILELKHLRQRFAPSAYAQTINYLKFWGMGLGILFNFGLERLCFERLPYTGVRGTVKRSGPWQVLESNQRLIIEEAADMCEAVWAQHGLGYSDRPCEGLLRAEFAFRGVGARNAVVKLGFQGVELGERALGPMLLDSGVMVYVTALQDNTSAADLARLRSYIRRVDGSVGLLVNFGKKELQMRPVFGADA